MSNPKHAIINTPQLQTQIIVWDEPLYKVVHMQESNDAYYIVGQSGINCVSSPMDQMRMIWDQQTANVIVDELNKKFPAENDEKKVDS